MIEYKYIELVHFIRSYLYNNVYSDDMKYRMIGEKLMEVDSVQFARFMFNPPSYKVEVENENYSLEYTESIVNSAFDDILRNILKENLPELKEECKRILERNLGYKNDISVEDFVNEVFANVHLLYSSVAIETDNGLKIVWLTV